MLQSYLDQTLSFFRLAPLLNSEDSFNELLQIFKGQDIHDFIKINNDLKEKYKDNPDEYFIESENLHDNWFDGSGLKSWWD